MVGGEEEGRHATPAVLVYHTHSAVHGFEALMPRRGFDWGDRLLRGWRSAQHCILHEESEDRSICNVEAFSPGKKDQILVVFNRSPF